MGKLCGMFTKKPRGQYGRRRIIDHEGQERRAQSDSGASKCSLVGPCKASKLRKSEVTGSFEKRSDMICVIFDRVGRLGKDTDQIGKINRETSQRL